MGVCSSGNFYGRTLLFPGRIPSRSEDLLRGEAAKTCDVPGAAYSQEVSVMNETIVSKSADPAMLMKQLIEEIVQALVDDPQSLAVDVITENDSSVIRVRVAHDDIGKVIGKQGRTARSLRTILGAASMKLHHRFALDIIEDD